MKNTIRKKLKMHETAEKQETAYLIAVQTPKLKDWQVTEYLEELEFLATTAGAITTKKVIQKLQHPDKRTYIGSGKLEELKMMIVIDEPDILIFDDELSPAQVRNLEKELNSDDDEEHKIKILDRSHLILDIFAEHAQTAQAKLQVELAQNQYLLPRLTRMWTHLSKHQGGIGTRGPGETEIETDRRVIRETISLLKKKLADIDKQSETRRKNRENIIRVALVGYTNVGKSTLLNLLSKAEVLVENKLFATLDATVRKVVYDQTPFLLTDTVGFIRKLPHHLVECFKSTLDEIREADLLLHVVDISHPYFEEQMLVVDQTLLEITAMEKPTIIVFNKIDKYNAEDHPVTSEDDVQIPVSLDELRRTWMAKTNASVVFVSAEKRTNIDELRDKISKTVSSLYQISDIQGY